MLDRPKNVDVESSFNSILKTSIAQEDSANKPDFRHINNRHTSISVTSLLVNFLLFVATGFVASTEFFGNVISSFFTLGTTEGLAGVIED